MIVLNKRLLKRLKRWVGKGNSIMCFTEDYQIAREVSLLKIGKEYCVIEIMPGDTLSGVRLDTSIRLNWALATKIHKVDLFQQWADEAKADYDKELGRQQSNLAKKVLGVA